jgi:hypothetical protein
MLLEIRGTPRDERDRCTFGRQFPRDGETESR